ncbi:MAG: translocation/assembly module TamB domain-containing protein [Roseobacter sp.]
MKHLLKHLAYLTLVLLPLGAIAQQTDEAEEDDGGFLTRTIENALSGAGREVDLQGFQGALSAEASFDRLTIADADGTWLTLEDVKLLWSRAALLRGRLQVEELSAQRLDLPRLPKSQAGPALPDAEAEPFALPQIPDLPVSVNIDRFSVAEITLGEPLIGVPVVAQLTAAARLDDDGLLLNLDVLRTDAFEGRFALAFDFSREDGQIALDFDVQEAPDGIAARLMKLPGQPELELSIAGTGPVDDFTAQIDLLTDGMPRLEGQVELLSVAGAEDTAPDTRVIADLGGDITALIAPEYQPFFGPDMGVRVDVTRAASGALDVSDLRLAARAAQLAGTVRLNEDMWPVFIALDGRIGQGDGQRVVPPGANAGTSLQSADLSVDFDAASGDALSAVLSVLSFEAEGASLDTARLTFDGTLDGAAGAIGRFDGDLSVRAEGLGFADAALAEAVGQDVTLSAALAYQEGDPFAITGLQLQGTDYDLAGDVVIEAFANGFPTDLTLALAADDLSRFAALSGQDLSGRADLDISGQITPLSGMFDLEIAGATVDVATGIEAADNVLAGTTDLSLAALRDTSGTFVRGLTLRNPAVDVTADVAIRTQGSEVNAAGRLSDLALVVPDHPGPVSFEVDAAQANGGWRVEAALDAPYDTALRVAGMATGPNTDLTIDFDLPDVQPLVPDFSGPVTIDGQIGQRNGGYTVDVSGTAPLDARFDVAGVATGPEADLDIRVSLPDIAPLVPDLTGGVTVEGAVRQAETGYAVDLTGTGPLASRFGLAGLATGPEMALTFETDLPDLQPLVPQLQGPVRATGVVELVEDAQYAIDVAAEGPLGALLKAAGVATGPEAEITFDLALADLTPLVPQLEGPTEISGTVRQAETGYAVAVNGTGPLSATYRADGLATGPDTDIAFDLSVPSLQTFAAQLSGATDVGGRVWLSDAGYNVDVTGTGPVAADYSVAGLVTGPEAAIILAAQIPNLGALVPQMGGALALDAALDRAPDGWRVDSTVSGPASAAAQIQGLVADDSTLDMTVTGQVPLELAAPFIKPRSLAGSAQIDLAISGPAGLEAVSGRIATSGAQFTDPTQRISLTGLETTVDISGSTLNLQAGGDIAAGGRVEAGGTLGLSGSLPADLTIDLLSVVLTDPQLYSTTIDGDIAISGPLAGDASISGTLNVGETNVSVPASGLTSVGAIPDILHIGSSGVATKTRSWAGIEPEPETDSAQGANAGFGLDIDIDAPSKIFIRGRGLEAELGGDIEIGGTTAQVISAGQFELIRGRLDILGKRFDLVEGTAQFVGSTTPLIRFVTTASTPDGTASIIVEGPADEPEVTFESTPEAPEDEVIAQLLFNRNISELTAFQALQLANAVAVLAGRSGIGVIGSLREGLGLDDFDVTTTDTGETALRAGKYLTEDIYTDFTAAANGESELSINYEFTDSLKARATVEEDGNSGVGFFFERDY